MKNLKKVSEQKKFEAICRELNDLVNSAHLPKEISITYSLHHYSNYDSMSIYFYKWELNEHEQCEKIVDNIWFDANTALSNFDYKINIMRNALIAYKKREFVWSEQAAIAKQTL